MSCSSWLRDVRRLAAEFGATADLTNGGHLAIRHPAGWCVYAASTPGDGKRALLNLRSQIRRAATAGSVHPR